MGVASVAELMTIAHGRTPLPTLSARLYPAGRLQRWRPFQHAFNDQQIGSIRPALSASASHTPQARTTLALIVSTAVVERGGLAAEVNHLSRADQTGPASASAPPFARSPFPTDMIRIRHSSAVPPMATSCGEFLSREDRYEQGPHLDHRRNSAHCGAHHLDQPGHVEVVRGGVTIDSSVACSRVAAPHPAEQPSRGFLVMHRAGPTPVSRRCGLRA